MSRRTTATTSNNNNKNRSKKTSPPTNHNTNNADSSRMKDHPPPPPPLSSSAGSTLPLFVPEHPDLRHPTDPSSSSSSSPSPRMGCYFSLAQWQELELQALIYRYMISGASVPPELLHPIRKSLACRPPPPPPFIQQIHPRLPYFLQSQPFRFQSGYWGRTSMDPEPGRCHRTDGKKWRCSRDTVPGQKYCERHVHRGRNRSRKPVEVSPTNASQCLCPGITNPKSYTGSVTVASSISAVTDGSHFNVSGPSRAPIDLFLMSSPSNFSARSEPNGGQVLRHFFDDWPRTLQEPDAGSLTGLSMSIGRSSSSDVSLKLATGDGERDRTRGSDWLTGWSSPSRVAPVGGPLAEALRSSTSTTDHSSPTSVLHRLPCGLAAETDPNLVTR